MTDTLCKLEIQCNDVSGFDVLSDLPSKIHYGVRQK